MATIHVLPEELVAKIAAGEVIERPVYAVKELVENAIDAKADTITIAIEQSGLSKIIVTDNGLGISKEDLQLAIKPHTTSKLLKEEDLYNIQTLGFRGEALSSIAAISNLVIKSKTKNASSGWTIEVKRGKILNLSQVGMPQGTTIIVSNLFANVPARKKFLKSPQTEFRKIVEYVVRLAVSHPHIRFTLHHNNRQILDLPKEDIATERIKNVLGQEIFLNVVPLKFEDSYITLSGFLAHPRFTTQTQSKQYVFVNDRPVSNKTISLAIKEAYGSLLDSASQPIFVLFVIMPTELVDVNVHPRKELVTFVNSKMVFDTLYQAALKTLTEHNLTFHNISWLKDLEKLQKGSTKTFAAELLKNTTEPWKLNTTPEKSADVVQFHNVYLLTQTKDGIILIDQHAAHERILSEQFENEFKTKSKKQLALQSPVVLDVSTEEQLLLEEFSKDLNLLGFIVKKQSGKYIVTKVPELVKDQNMISIIKELLETLGQKNSIGIDSKNKKMLAYLACRSAIKAGDKLTKQEAKNLIEKLEKTPNNATCPHGRPTKIILNKQLLDSMFGR